MLYTGKQCKVLDDYDLDHKINEVVELTQEFIKDLIDEVGIRDYRKIAKVVINEHLDKM